MLWYILVYIVGGCALFDITIDQVEQHRLLRATTLIQIM